MQLQDEQPCGPVVLVLCRKIGIALYILDPEGSLWQVLPEICYITVNVIF